MPLSVCIQFCVTPAYSCHSSYTRRSTSSHACIPSTLTHLTSYISHHLTPYISHHFTQVPSTFKEVLKNSQWRETFRQFLIQVSESVHLKHVSIHIHTHISHHYINSSTIIKRRAYTGLYMYTGTHARIFSREFTLSGMT